MDTIYEYLKADHKKVANLFKQFEKAPNTTSKFDYVAMIVKELLVHAESEEATFYKKLEEYESSEGEVFHGEEEHQEIRALISEITSTPVSNNLWVEKVLELKRMVEHHVHDEEAKLFRQAKKVLTDEDAYVLREKMHDMKEKILTRLSTEEDSKNII